MYARRRPESAALRWRGLAFTSIDRIRSAGGAISLRNALVEIVRSRNGQRAAQIERLRGSSVRDIESTRLTLESDVSVAVRRRALALFPRTIRSHSGTRIRPAMGRAGAQVRRSPSAGSRPCHIPSITRRDSRNALRYSMSGVTTAHLARADERGGHWPVGELSGRATVGAKLQRTGWRARCGLNGSPVIRPGEPFNGRHDRCRRLADRRRTAVAGPAGGGTGSRR